MLPRSGTPTPAALRGRVYGGVPIQSSSTSLRNCKHPSERTTAAATPLAWRQDGASRRCWIQTRWLLQIWRSLVDPGTLKFAGATVVASHSFLTDDFT